MKGKILSGEAKERARISRNSRIIFLIFSLFLFLTLGRYAWLQIVRGSEMADMMKRQTSELEVRHMPRGKILDRNGQQLAISIMTKSLFVDPNSVKNADDVAKKLSPLIAVPEKEILADIATGGGFAWVKHYLTDEEYKAVRKLIADENYNCLNFVDEAKRYYPSDMLAANVIGFVGLDNKGRDEGKSGIEYAYDKQIKGGTVEALVQTDNADRPIFDSILKRQPYRGDQCKTIELTIDGNIQFIVEQALDEAVVANRPESVTAIVMNPKSGEVLAMASRPSFNPNNFDDYPKDTWRNHAVSSIYEPGSTFKSVVAAAALQENAVTPYQVFVDPGYIMVSERRIQNWNGESFGTVTFTDVVKNSLNTGFAYIGLQLGADKLTKYAKLFGFGEETGIELPGEEAGILFDPDDMRDSDIATMSIGQSIAVTPLQLISAVSAIANDGILMRPYIVKAVRNADGSYFETTQPKSVRQAIDSVTSKTLVGLLEQVVATGGGQKAAVKGYRIAGKTGTAEKIRVDGAGYQEGRYIASFCGFAPVENPQLTVLVVINDPTGGDFYGGQIAAPVASRIFDRLFRYLHIAPSENIAGSVEPR